MSKPNILWICADQQRYDTIGALGNPHIRTPNLDQLCSEGTAFSNTYTQSPICTPSRSSFLSGLYPSSIHVLRNGQAEFPSHVKLITKRLSEQGYRCGLAGKLHLSAAYSGRETRTDDGYEVVNYSHSPVRGVGTGNDYTNWLQEQGLNLDDVLERDEEGEFVQYKRDIPVQYHQTTWCIDRAMDFISTPKDQPWLMSINMFDPHTPFDAPQIYEDRYNPDELPRPLFKDSDLETQQKLFKAYHQTRYPKAPDADYMRKKANYYGMIELIDEQVGRLFELLDQTGQRHNTIIIFMSDHGEMLGDHGLIHKGSRFYEGAVHVPLIISWKGQFKEGAVIDELVELVDITPTLADIVGIELEHTHGRSLLPLLTGASSAGVKHREFVRSEYYDTLTERKAKDEPQIDNPPTYATMYFDGRYKLVVYHHLDFGELYDHERDPGEFDNLWEDDSYIGIKAGLLKRSFDSSMLIMDQGSPKILPF